MKKRPKKDLERGSLAYLSLSHDSVASLVSLRRTRMNVLKNETGLNNSANTGERESTRRRCTWASEKKKKRERETHSSSRAYAGAAHATSGRVARPLKEHQTLMPRTRTLGSLNHSPRTLAQQSIETCLFEEGWGRPGWTRYAFREL